MRPLLSLVLVCIIALCALLPRLCECSSESTTKQQDIFDLRCDSKERCFDCGHTKSCCSSKPQIPGGLTSNNDCSVWSFSFAWLVTWVSAIIFNESDRTTFSIERSVYPSIAKWPCAKSYLAKQSLLIWIFSKSVYVRLLARSRQSWWTARSVYVGKHLGSDLSIWTGHRIRCLYLKVTAKVTFALSHKKPNFHTLKRV